MGRRAGILLAMSSLPAGAAGGSSTRRAGGVTSTKGSGVLGDEAYRFVDFLADAGQSCWQVLPIGPVGKTLSPYQSRSAFAGNPEWIAGGKAIHSIGGGPKPSLRGGRFFAGGEANHSIGGDAPPSYAKFLDENGKWLDDYALFEAVRGSQGGRPLSRWPEKLRNPSAKTIAELRNRYADEIEAVRLEQYTFFTQWKELKRCANLKGIGIIGDLPIYVYEDSAEFWLRRRLFDVGEDGRPRTSAGVPPDRFSKDGQIWNNPVYDWDRRRKEVIGFWRERFAQAERLYDGVRIDHFRAFADYYVYPLISGNGGGADSATASAREFATGCEGQNKANLRKQADTLSAIGGAPEGEWRKGPGKAFTDMIRKEFPGLFVIAEDLGELSDAAVKLVEDSGFPGMKVMQFAFSGNPDNPYLPHNITENSVCFTGTHDNNTLLGWAAAAQPEEKKYAMEYFGLTQKEVLPAAILSAALASRAATVIIPLQDWLGLGGAARMNKPGTAGGRNWKWQYTEGALTPKLAARIRHATKNLYGR